MKIENKSRTKSNLFKKINKKKMKKRKEHNLRYLGIDFKLELNK